MFRGTGFWAAIYFFISLTAGAAFGQDRAPSRGAQKPEQAPFMIEAESHEESSRITRTVFKNGLTALIYESHAQPLVSIQTYVSAGFLDEPDGMTGLSEITARARENVGEGSTAGAVAGRAKGLGGVFRGRADSRYSRFEITVPSARWKQALNIHAEAILTPFENNEALRLSIGRLAESMRDGSAPGDFLNAFAGDELLALAFGERRFARPGQPLKIAPEEIIEFHKSRYIPSAITLVVAGDVRAGDMLNEIARVFGSNSESAGSATARATAATAGTGLKPAGKFRCGAVSGDAAFPKVFFGFPVSSKNPEDYRALEVAAAILGIGETSVLNTRLRGRKDLIFTARAEMKFFGGAGFFSVELETEPKNIDRTEAAFWTELEILKREDPSGTELARAIAQLERLWWERRETAGGLADALAMSEFQGGWKRMDGYIAEIRKVTAADVRRALTRHLTLSNCALLEYLPRSAAERNSAAAAVRETLENLPRTAVNKELSARVGENEPNLKIPPAGAAFRSNEARHPFQAASILRGPEIYIREDHTSPLLEMGFYFMGGKARENETNAGITGLMLELMLGNERENRQLEIYGGSLTSVVADDYFGFFLSIPASNSSGGFERIKQAIKSPVFDGAEFEKLKHAASARARASTAQNGELRRLKEALFRGHPYAAEFSATQASLKNISMETVRDWYEENVRNVKPFAAIVGDTEGTALASWFVRELSGSRMKEMKEIVPSPGPVEKTEALDYSGDAGRPAVMLGFQAPSFGDMDVYGMFVLKNYLENRPWEAEETAKEILKPRLAGGRIACEYRTFLAGGSFIISAGVKAGDEAAGMKSLRESVERLVAQPLAYADFHAARTLAAGSYMAENQTRKAQIENLTKNLLAGGSLEEYHGFSQNIGQAGEEDFEELTRRVLDMKKAVTMTVHGGNP